MYTLSGGFLSSQASEDWTALQTLSLRLFLQTRDELAYPGRVACWSYSHRTRFKLVVAVGTSTCEGVYLTQYL
jgi:hypothetical protein